MRQIFFQTIAAVGLVWAVVLALSLSGCIVEQSTAYRTISGKQVPAKVLRMPAFHSHGVRS